LGGAEYDDFGKLAFNSKKKSTVQEQNLVKHLISKVNSVLIIFVFRNKEDYVNE